MTVLNTFSCEESVTIRETLLVMSMPKQYILKVMKVNKLNSLTEIHSKLVITPFFITVVKNHISMQFFKNFQEVNKIYSITA